MSSDPVDPLPTQQEMFDRAYRGLASQGWRYSYLDTGCQYSMPDPDDPTRTMRCAWGWVDPVGTEGHGGIGIFDLRDGLAGRLTGNDWMFARELQRTHDDGILRSRDRGWGPDKTLRARMENFARTWNLSVPELAP